MIDGGVLRAGRGAHAEQGSRSKQPRNNAPRAHPHHIHPLRRDFCIPRFLIEVLQWTKCFAKRT